MGAFGKMGFLKKSQRDGMFIARMLKKTQKPLRGGMETSLFFTARFLAVSHAARGFPNLFSAYCYKHAVPAGTFSEYPIFSNSSVDYLVIRYCLNHRFTRITWISRIMCRLE
ncbi:MAG: hypothetical protein GY795_05975 [Desulfobacterales bacterium]|nr:hypothetical protein [Desulfobacterales bacterium]